MIKKIIYLLIALLPLTGTAQKQLFGSWYGSGNVVSHNDESNYLMELIVYPENGRIKGVLNYFFKNTFRSFDITGQYNTAKREITFHKVPLTYYGSISDLEVDCMMNLWAKLRTSRVDSILEGYFYSSKEYANVCPDVAFSLTKTADISKKDSLLADVRSTKERYQYWTPPKEETVITTAPLLTTAEAAAILQKDTARYYVKKAGIPEKTTTGTSIDPATGRPTGELKNTPVITYAREKNVAKEILTDQDSVILSFYDNGEIDGDSISVFVNNELKLFAQRLSTKAISITLPVSEGQTYEITMHAENLGTIPPNTALMVLRSGTERYQINLTSDLEQSATIIIKRKPKEKKE